MLTSDSPQQVATLDRWTRQSAPAQLAAEGLAPLDSRCSPTSTAATPARSTPSTATKNTHLAAKGLAPLDSHVAQAAQAHNTNLRAGLVLQELWYSVAGSGNLRISLPVLYKRV